MTQKRHLFINTNFFLAAPIFILVALLPVLSMYVGSQKELNDLLAEAKKETKNLEIPTVTFDNGTVHLEGKQPFHQKFEGSRQGDSLELLVDTRETPDRKLIEQIKKASTGIALLKNTLIIRSAQNGKTQEIDLSTIPMNFVLNKENLQKFLEQGFFYFILIVYSFLLVFSFFVALSVWLLLAMIYSGKSKECGGGHYSLAVWTLVPVHVVLSICFFLGWGACGACGIYILSTIVGGIFFQKFLKTPIEE